MNNNSINSNVIVNNKQINYNKIKIFLISLLLLESLQICAFVSLDLLLFYVFFESVLPILFILIMLLFISTSKAIKYNISLFIYSKA